MAKPGGEDEDEPGVQVAEFGAGDEVADGLDDDDEGDEKDERAFGAGGERFNFAVSVGVVGVGGPGGDAQGENEKQRGGDIDERFGGVGPHGERSGRDGGGGFHTEQRDADDQRNPPGVPRGVVGGMGGGRHCGIVF